MPTSPSAAFSRILDEANEDQDEVTLELVVGDCATLMLLMLKEAAEGGPHSEALPALLRYLSAFAAPVITNHPEIEEYVRMVLYNSTGVILITD